MDSTGYFQYGIIWALHITRRTSHFRRLAFEFLKGKCGSPMTIEEIPGHEHGWDSFQWLRETLGWSGIVVQNFNRISILAVRFLYGCETRIIYWAMFRRKHREGIMRTIPMLWANIHETFDPIRKTVSMIFVFTISPLRHRYRCGIQDIFHYDCHHAIYHPWYKFQATTAGT